MSRRPSVEAGWLPLTAAQRGVYFGHQVEDGSAAFTTAEIVELTGEVDADRLADAIEQTYLEHEFLRMRFRHGAGGPEQQVMDRPFATLSVVDVRSGGAAAADAWVKRCIETPLDLSVGEVTRTVLLQVSDDVWWWFHAAHHVVTDGFGFVQLARRVAERYRGTPREVVVASAAEVVADDARRPADPAAWTPRLRALAASTSGDSAVASPAPRALRVVREIDPDLQEQLQSAARELGVGWSEFVTAAVATCLARQRDGSVRVGVPTMNRMDAEHGTLASARTVCTAVNVLPVGVVLEDTTVAEVVADVREQLADLARGGHPREEDLARELRLLDGGRLYSAQINILPLDPVLAFGDSRGRIRNIAAGPVEDMTWCVRGVPGRGRPVMLEVDANPRVHEPGLLDVAVDRALAWCATFAAASAEARVEALPILPEAERDLVLAAFNATGQPVEARALAEAFSAQVAATPDATALVHGGDTWTYRQLDHRARQLATRIPAGATTVGVALPRSLDLFAAIYAVVLRGAAYVPIDPDLPARRVADMIEDAKISAILCADDVASHLPDGPLLVSVSGDPVGFFTDEVLTDLDAPAYVLFTSGSTGRPKGVEVSHRAIDNRLAWMQHELRLEPGEVVLHKTPISFDVSVWELFWPLQVGATVVIADPGGHRDPRYLAQLIADMGVTTLHFVPSMLRAFLSDRRAVEVAGGRLRNLVCSGEALTPDLVRDAEDALGVVPINLYGPTEAAVDVTVWRCDADRDSDVVPIGRPIWNTRAYVLDEHAEPVPVGVPGELHLAGVQLATGYVGRPDLTAAAFVPDPFVPGERMYRTGDRARWQPDGSLVYLGRMDGQVKIRGQRLELGEVDHVLQQVDGIVAAATLALPGSGGEDRLVAFYVPEAGVTAAAVRSVVQGYLPAFMVPEVFVPIERMPLSSSGKIDRSALVARVPADEARVTASPGSLLEQEVCRAMSEALGGACGPDDDFFAIGGHSLLALKVVTDLSDALGVDVRFADVFAHPTPRALSARIAGLRSGAETAGDELGPLLTLRAGDSSAVPLFALPPAGGLGWCYTGLLRHLPSGQPLHVLQADGMDGSPVGLPADLGEMAARYLDLIRGIVGDGPFHLVGWSIGGMAAHAVAAQAQADGQRVGLVAMLDAYPSDQWQHLDPPDESEALRAVVRMAGAEHRIDADAVLTHAAALDVLRGEGSALASLPPETIAASVRSVVNGAAVVRTSEHAVLDGDVLLVAAGAPRAETWLDPAGWRPYVGGTLQVEVLDATHPDLVREPHIGAVAQLLADRLAAWS